MSKENLINAIVEASDNISRKDAEKAIKLVTDGVSDCIANGDTVSLIGFGKFEVTEQSARTARNPQTSEEMNIPAKNAVKFRVGAKLKALANK